MEYSKIKNGIRIVVEQWSSVVKLFDVKTGVLLKESTFSDHLIAIHIAKNL